jgi:hypothetical protein
VRATTAQKSYIRYLYQKVGVERRYWIKPQSFAEAASIIRDLVEREEELICGTKS